RSKARAVLVIRTDVSSSVPSSETHAQRRPCCRAHCANKVVLPYPGGAVTQTTGANGLVAKRSTRAVRGTMPARAGGGRNFGSDVRRARACDRVADRVPPSLGAGSTLGATPGET